ncbi:G-protein coupled receptor-like K2 [Exaiptasia diaphana]|nr:G-protein coupled receptor-like K2 [Exaiptasia diaphana]
MNNSSLIPDNATNNSSGYYCKYEEPDTQLEYNAKRIAVILLMTLGLAGNIFVIVLAMKFTERKNLHHLIINMAVSDTLFILMNLTEDIGWLSNYKLSLTYPDGILGDILCKTKWLLNHISYNVSLVTLLIISIERFRATRRTLQRSRVYTLRKILAIIGISWLIPMTLQSYNLYYFKLDPERGISTIRRLSRPRAIHAHLNQEQRKARARRTQAAVRMVLASVMLYTCCWFPTFIYNSVLVNVDVWVVSVRLFISYFCLTFEKEQGRYCVEKTDRNENRGNSMELRQMPNNPPLEPEGRRRRRRYSNDEEEQHV